ncbi:rRNA-processing protein EBP2 [Diplonema papillatum]|nr:rRNA-processing protein EBP2 [Diplonema papillatum]
MPVFSRFGKSAKPDDAQDEEEEEPEDVDDEDVEEVEEIEEVEEVEEDEEATEADKQIMMSLPKVPADWAERLQITAQRPLKAGGWNVDDDGLREELFEKQALVAVEQAMHLLKQHKIPNKRPSDYYAEMVKSDVHMAKIKDVMDRQTGKIKAQQQRRHDRHAKKFGKAVQEQVLSDRQAKKSEAFERISRLKKKSKSQGMAAVDDRDIDVAFGGDRDAGDEAKGAPAKRKRSLTPGQRPSKKPKTQRPGKSKRRK